MNPPDRDEDLAMEVAQRLARIEAKLDHFTDTIKDHGTKIEALERKVNWGHGVVAAVLFILTFFKDLVNRMIQ